MPSPEEQHPPEPEHTQNQEREPNSYHKAARFNDENTAGLAYSRAQGLIFQRQDADLSVYRIKIPDEASKMISHVVVLGEPPSVELDQRIEGILALGQLAQIPPDILEFLLKRREQARHVAPWMEGHYRPGKKYRL